MFVVVINAMQKYKSEGHDMVILAGDEYGAGSSRDSAAKGPLLLVINSSPQKDYAILNLAPDEANQQVVWCFGTGRQGSDRQGLRAHPPE